MFQLRESFYGSQRRFVARVALLLCVVSCVSDTAVCGQANETKNTALEAEQAKAQRIATSALKLLHANQIPKLYQEYYSELQKSTGLTSEAKAIGALGPTAQITPGEPKERILLTARRTDMLPVFFRDHKADYFTFVFLAKYPAGGYQEEVYLVNENGVWKIAAIVMKETF